MEEKEKSIAMEMLEELKRSNDRLEKQNERLERQAKDNGKKWFIISLVLLVALVISNISWLVYESQYEYSDEVYTQDITEIESSDIMQSIN